MVQKARPILLGKKLLKQVLIIILTVSLILTSLFVPFVLIPALFYRQLVITLAKWRRPDLSKIMPIANSYFALNDLQGPRAKANIVVGFVFDGPLRIDETRETFKTRVLEKQREENANANTNGELFYPELQQSWTQFLGFLFWKWETNFNLAEHVRVCEGPEFKLPEILNHNDFQGLTTRLLSEPWKKDFSPWELLYIPKYVDNKLDKNDGKFKSAVIIRFAHAMGDGHGWLKLLTSDLLQMENPNIPMPSIPKSKSVWKLLFFPVKLPYDIASNFVDSYDSSRSPWHAKGQRSREHLSSMTSSIPTSVIKDLKNKFGVSYSAILISVISGGIRRVMEEAKQRVPKSMAGFVTLPWPNHPGGITIHATGIYLRWPISVQDPLTRLNEVTRELNEKQSSLFPVGLFWIGHCLGMFPTFVRRIMYNRMVCTLMVSLFPGPLNTPVHQDHSLIDSCFYIGLPAGASGASVTTVVVGSRQRLVLAIDKNLFPCAIQFSKLGQFIEDEIEKLQKVATTFTKEEVV